MKPRLFCFGDSFVDWHLPKFHWTYYFKNHYEVIKLGKWGADNNSILFQLGNLDDYREGDRIIVYFTDAGRLPRRYYGDRKEAFFDTPYRSPNFFRDNRFALKLDYLSLKEGDNWVNGVRQNDINFIKNLKKWLSIYSPVFVTWSEQFYLGTSDFVTLIQTSTNWEEGVGEEEDFHPGPNGCYTIYKKLHELLKVDEPIVDFEIDASEKDFL